MELRPSDGVWLHAVHLPATSLDGCAVLAHGFTDHTGTGHGRSGGAGGAVARVVLRTRIWPLPWDPQPASPVECIVDVAALPLLLVHGDAEKATTPDLIVRRARQIRSLVPA